MKMEPQLQGIEKGHHMDAEEPAVPDNATLLTIPEAIAALRIGRSQFFDLKKQGRIGTIQVGKRTLVPRREIVRVMDEELKRPK